MDNLGAIVAQPIESRCPGLRSLLVSGESIRRQPLIERKTALKWVLRKAREGIQYVEHAEGHGDKLFAAVCNLGLEGIVSKRLTSARERSDTRL